MATEVTVRVAPGGDPSVVDAALNDALGIFGQVERSCTRFDTTSPLMVANARPHDWHRVPRECFDAVTAAWEAYRGTAGRFDPRVIADLVALGYDRSLPFGAGEVTVAATTPRRRLSRPPWRPRFRRATGEICLGHPVDLGGIGKGLAVRWASDRLRAAAPGHLVNAGGDCYGAGNAPDGSPWRVGVEDPAGGDEPVAVVQLHDLASATSSIRVRHWRAGGAEVHHLIDPRSGLPGGPGLMAVTVLAPDPAQAEVWSKVLFLAGVGGIAAEARRRAVAACWVTSDGRFVTSPAMERFVLWRRP
jgi:thiamine biosynthesis lipoprotein